MQRVLVVDDERLVADTLTLVFTKNGFDVKTAYSADEALASARSFPPDLLLCDITMPGKDGLMLVKDMTREHPAVRIILLTGFYSNLATMHQHANRLRHPVGIFTKPCHPSDLLREANTLLAATA